MDSENMAISTGKSRIGVAKEAGYEAASIALAQLKGKSPKFAIIFASAGYNQDELLEGIIQVIGDIPSSGCTGEGIITPEGSDEGSTIVGVMLFAGDKIKFHNYFFQGLEKNSYGCGKAIARNFNELCKTQKIQKDNPGTLFIFPDSLTINITELFRAFEETLESNPLVLGGSAGDMMQLKKTYQYHNGKVYSDAVSVVHVFGDYKIDWEVTHGCEEIGLEQTVTKADKNHIIEIDGQKAWDILRKYLPNRSETLCAEDTFHYCLGEVYHFEPPIGEKLVIRAAMGMVPETGALKFSVEIPVGTKIHLTRRDPQVIADNVINAFKKLLSRNSNKKLLAVLQFDCSGRGHVIYGNNLNETVFNPLKKILPPGTPWLGFNTYGEIAPINGKNFYHNFTAVICMLFEK